MSLLNKIFKKDDTKKLNAGEVEVPLEFQENRFENIRIYAPDSVMYHEHWKDFKARVTDENNNPLANTELTFKINRVNYDRVTDDDGWAYLPITLRVKEFKIETTAPSNKTYAPTVISDLVVLKTPEDGAPEIESKIEDTIIYAPDMKIYRNDQPSYTIRLTDGKYNPIPNGKVTLTLNEETHTLTTDSEGFASIKVDKLDLGKYEITAKYDGDDDHNSACKTSRLCVLIRNVDRRVMIEIEHLAMEFKVSKDKIDTLKEYVIRTLKRTKKDSKKIRILDDITFKVYEGERLGILGFNGAGKSTLLRIISGIYEPTEGKITINGKVSPLLELSAGFDKNYTGKNNIFLNGAFLSMEEDFIKEKYDEILEFSELGEYINYPVKNYSKGMRAKLGFSIATLMNPEILIIDEILGVGDIKFKKKSSEKLQSMMEEGVTVLLVSHSISQIRKICDRCVWIENGVIVMEGDSKEVCDAYIASTEKIRKKKRK